jgi:NAD(P)H-dependent flavin oxidoreductase YrpB (nitropropane dioxygenase family)
VNTRITELLGIRFPIVCAGMSAVATPRLAADEVVEKIMEEARAVKEKMIHC